jgi:multidrug efflux pump
LLPMVTGIAYNFHEMEIAWVSESSQWWRAMASAVIFGLALATVLTLVVVPTLYEFVYTARRDISDGVERIRKAYWALFHRLAGTAPEEDTLDQAHPRSHEDLGQRR